MHMESARVTSVTIIGLDIEFGPAVVNQSRARVIRKSNNNYLVFTSSSIQCIYMALGFPICIISREKENKRHPFITAIIMAMLRIQSGDKHRTIYHTANEYNARSAAVLVHNVKCIDGY